MEIELDIIKIQNIPYEIEDLKINLLIIKDDIVIGEH